MTKPDYILSKNQKKFVKDAESQGFEIDYGYLGRFMFGRCCPSIQAKGMGEFSSKSKICWDQLGLRFVIYAKD